MKRYRSFFVMLLFGLLFPLQLLAQDQPSTAAEAAADLRIRLIEVQTSEAERHARLNELEEALRPENIERSVNGFGSTRPEELRAQRSRELTIERDLVRRQLDLLATSRVRLEAAIQAADNRAYQQSAQGFAANKADATSIFSIAPGWLLRPLVAIVGLLVAGCLAVFYIRRQ